jgi:hypothetical protein
MIKTFDRAAVRTLRDDINEALAAVAKKHGISLSTGNVSFNARNANIKLVAAIIDESGVAQTPEKTAFRAYAPHYGLSPDDFGKTFRAAGKTYEIVGLKPKSHQYPILGKRADGKIFKFPAETVKFGLPAR